jgi:hypothetical protein
VSDLSALAACPFLENIDVGKTYVTSMAAFRGIERLRSLSMMDTPLESIAGVEEFDALEQIGFTSLADGDLSPLESLPRLKEARLGEDLRANAEADLAQAAFDIRYS